MKKICVVIGTRPEAIKMAPVVLALREWPREFEVSICSTGQHATMLDGAMAAFGIRPDVSLDVMHPGQTLAQLTSRLLLVLDQHFESSRPDVVLVHGDTTSAMTAALAAFYRQMEVGHVEAGLRTHNLWSPFPEEYNRRSVAIAAAHHFAPTAAAGANLEQEGVPRERILVTGNTVIDALQLTIRSLAEHPDEVSRLRSRMNSMLGFDPESRAFVLITAHRRENFGAGLNNICQSIRRLAEANPGLGFVYPVHLNPNVKAVVEEELSKITNVALIPPLDYREFAWLMNNCRLVLTDSGGIQEEAPSLGKPVLVMRDTSERPEAIDAGTAKLVSTAVEKIVFEVQRLIDDSAEYERMARSVNPFGDGRAATRIVNHLLESK